MAQSLLFILFCVLSLSSTAYAEGKADTEYKLKAAFIYNFSKQIELPAHADDGIGEFFYICALGLPAEGERLNSLDGKKVLSRTIRLLYLEPSLTALQGNQCHIVFVANSSENKTSHLLQHVRAIGALSIGENSEFCKLGGIINFYKKKNKLRFEISSENAEEAGIRLSSKLLRLARIVSTK